MAYCLAVLDEPLDAEAANAEVLRIMEFGIVRSLHHGAKRLEERELSMADCLNVLRAGAVVDIRLSKGTWRYRLERQIWRSLCYSSRRMN
jgi:hypothetical protein